jgi:hypothetical protein
MQVPNNPQIFSAKVRILLAVRPNWHNWLFRLVALLTFISGGALARVMVEELDHHFASPVREVPKHQFSMVALEVRQPVPVQLDGAAATLGLLSVVLLFGLRPQTWLEVHPMLAKARAFDALAPPVHP